ncbi:MAG: YihY/virulence factor BrkB family protein, partial [Desulfocapsa sp.]|nr:YihY/virulence factor BrkB family protein [Desulfocapsa sp.]
MIKRLLGWANTPIHDSPLLQQKLHTFVRIILITLKEFGNNSLNIRASALTYTILLSLVPMLAMSTAVIKGLGGGDELRQVVYSYLDTLEETTPLTNFGLGEELLAKSTIQTDTRVTDQFRTAADQIFKYVDNTDFATLGTIGVLGVLFSAILVLSNIELSMNTIWHVTSGRSLLRKVSDYLTFLILMPLSINFGFAANAVLKNDTLQSKVLGFLPGPWIETGLLLFVPLFFITMTLFLIYIFFPNTKVKPGPAFTGALFAGGFWFFTQNIYIGLQIGVSKYNAIYGSFATLPLFLIWMFLGWLFILAGAQLAFACQRHESYQLKKLTHEPLELLSAAFDILNVNYDLYAKKKKLTKKELPSHCPAYPVPLVYESLQKLLSSQIVLRTKEGYLLPSCPAD